MAQVRGHALSRSCSPRRKRAPTKSPPGVVRTNVRQRSQRTADPSAQAVRGAVGLHPREPVAASARAKTTARHRRSGHLYSRSGRRHRAQLMCRRARQTPRGLGLLPHRVVRLSSRRARIRHCGLRSRSCICCPDRRGAFRIRLPPSRQHHIRRPNRSGASYALFCRYRPSVA
jgi:hypothetical protein